MIDAAELGRLLPDFLPRQRWYGAGERSIDGVDIDAFEILRGGPGDWPVLAWALAAVGFADGGRARYQVPVGVRPLVDTERFLEGKGRQYLGDVDTDEGPVLVYDALVDPDLCRTLLHKIAPDEHAERVWPLTLEQSNTSIVYDERLILKVFRRLHAGPNPDVEVTEALGRVGFDHALPPMALWRQADTDLAVLRRFLVMGTDGWHLALPSLRDMYDRREHPAGLGGDFAPEAERLGVISAQMHAALAEAFPVEAGRPADWAGEMLRQLEKAPTDRFDEAAVRAVYERLAGLDDAGVSIRIHGDYHLGQTMRTDEGWFVLDFEGEPMVPLEERRRPSSPLRDVAGMLRSFQYAAQVGLRERGEEADAELADLARVWEERVSRAFLDGYASVEEAEALLPDGEEARHTALDAFVVAKAVYEIGYEIGHRPDWVDIPTAGLVRQLEGARG